MLVCRHSLRIEVREMTFCSIEFLTESLSFSRGLWAQQFDPVLDLIHLTVTFSTADFPGV
jgi:hypothetical protein